MRERLRELGAGVALDVMPLHAGERLKQSRDGITRSIRHRHEGTV